MRSWRQGLHQTLHQTLPGLLAPVLALTLSSACTPDVASTDAASVSDEETAEDPAASSPPAPSEQTAGDDGQEPGHPTPPPAGPGANPEPPADATLTGVPQTPSAATTLDVTVGGARVVTYAFVLVTGGGACPTSVPATFTAIAQKITAAVNGGGDYALCVWGKSQEGLVQASPTRQTWTTDQTSPLLASTTPGSLRLTDVVDGHVSLSGTASDAASGLQQVSVSLKRDGGSCLNGAKSAFDATCPEAHLVTAMSGTYTLAVPAALLEHGAQYEITTVAVDAAGNSEQEVATFTWSRELTLYIGIQNSGSGGSFVQKLRYVVGATAADDVSGGNVTVAAAPTGGKIMLAPHVANQQLRGMALNPNGEIVAGSGSANLSALIDGSDTVSAGPVTAGTTLGNIHGICFLPNGHFIAGYYNGGTADIVREYAGDGTYVRDVYTTTVNSMTDCVAKSSTELYLVDYDADNDNAGTLVHRVLTAGSWTAAPAPTFAATSIAASSSIYSMVLHSDGDVYAAPQHQGGTRNVKMIKCPGGDLSQCSAVGSAVMVSGEGFMQGLAEIPGVGDLLLVSSTHLYRYDRATGTATSIFAVTGLSNVSQVRHIRIR